MEPKDNQRIEIKFGGFGGQGLLLGGLIYSRAAALYEGLNVVHSQSYGPEARGGASMSEIIISKGEIYHPKTVALDLLLCLNQVSCDHFAKELKDDGILIVDSTLVKSLPPRELFAIPFTEIAKEKIGKAIVTNIVALGAVSALSKFVSQSSIEKSIAESVPPNTIELNLKAFMEGREAGILALKGITPPKYQAT